MAISTKKLIRETKAILAEEGATVLAVETRKHCRFRFEYAGQEMVLVTPASPGDRNILMQIRGRVRRMLRRGPDFFGDQSCNPLQVPNM